MTSFRLATHTSDSSRLMMRAPRRLGLQFLLPAMSCALVLAANQSARGQQFSSGSEYKSMLTELHHDPPRPTRLSAGTLLDHPQPPKDLKVEDTSSDLRISSNQWKLQIAKDSWNLSIANAQTGATWQLEAAGVSWSKPSGEPRPSVTSVQNIEREGSVWRARMSIEGSAEPAHMELTVLSSDVIRLSIHAPSALLGDRLNLQWKASGPFFGLGERFDRVRLDGLKTVLRPEDLLGQPGHNWTYIPVPLVFTPRGLGLYMDTSAVSTFDLTQAAEDRFAVQLADSSVDLYLFVGDPARILENYTALTGRSPLPPPWAFGVWICSYQGPDKVLADARTLRQDKIPASAIWTYDVMGKGDIMGWPLWWTGYYPNPRHFTDKLHSMGFKVLTYVHPYLRSMLDPYNLRNPSYEEGLRDHLFVTNPQGQPTGPVFEPFRDGNINFTHPANVDWWQNRLQHILVDDNFDGWMEDYGEWINDTDQFGAGVTGRRMANLNPLFYHRITNEISRRAKPDVVEFSRSGYAGSQAYTPVVWGGDQFPNWTTDYGLPSVVRAGITAGMSGFAVWGPDIAANGHSRELWMRWVEFGALTPVMRNHLWDKPENAINLWHDPEATAFFREYARLHVSLFPYLYTFAADAQTTGLPLMRDLLFASPGDPHTWNLDDEYLLGDSILVAPVIHEGATTRSLYLPSGAWTNYWTGESVQGGRQVTVAAPVNQIPVFIRAGSILPLIPQDTETLAGMGEANPAQALTKDLIWRIYPADKPAQSHFRLFDGTLADVNHQKSQATLSVTHAPTARDYEVILPIRSIPASVVLDGKRLGEINQTLSMRQTNGWRMDPRDHCLHVFVNASDFTLQVGG
jgi:alpha-glucosidase (family GH31 glycosyl hydrolase)